MGINWRNIFGLCAFILFLVACTMQDDRDICCYNIRLDYRYCQNGNMNALKSNISRLRHFLFDADSVLVEVAETEGNACNKFERILPAGDYTIVSFANLNGISRLDSFEIGYTKMDEMRLYVDNDDAAGYQSECERLFYTYRDFTVYRSGTARYIVDMSHAYNELTVNVKWKGGEVPPNKHYVMELTDVPGDYAFSVSNHICTKTSQNSGDLPQSTHNEIVYTIPGQCGRFVKYRKEARFRPNGNLQGIFVSYRYTNRNIPSFCLYGDDGPLMKQINLSKLFYAMGWELDRNVAQVFDITLTIDGDKVYATPTVVNDWEDGGVIGAGTK